MRKVPLSLAVLIGVAAIAPSLASAAPPQIVSAGGADESVHGNSVVLEGSVNPEGLATSYRFEYLTEASYLANQGALPEEAWFTGASWKPSSGQGAVGTGTIPIQLHGQEVTGLASDTPYVYRLRAENSSVVAFSVARPFGTQPATNAFELLDHRGWEMVSPPDKAGGAIQP